MDFESMFELLFFLTRINEVCDLIFLFHPDEKFDNNLFIDCEKRRGRIDKNVNELYCQFSLFEHKLVI